MKKTFIDKIAETENIQNHPAMSWISQPKTEQKPDVGTAQPSRTPQKETKSIKINLLFTPTVKNGLNMLARLHNTSINSIVHKLAEGYLEEHKEELEKVSELFKEV